MTQYTREELTAWMRKPIDGRKVRADAAADRRIRAIAARPARASRAKWRPQPECPPGWGSVPRWNVLYRRGELSATGMGGTLGALCTFNHRPSARPAFQRGAATTKITGQKLYRRYDLAEVFRNAKNLDTDQSEAGRE